MVESKEMTDFDSNFFWSNRENISFLEVRVIFKQLISSCFLQNKISAV